MNSERVQVGWRFWLWWMLASAVFPSVVVATVLVIIESLPDSDPQQQLGAVLLGIAFLTLTVIAQWLVLRRQIPRAGGWVLAGMVGIVVGLVAGLVAGVFVGLTAWVIFLESLGGPAVGLTAGLAVGLGMGLAVGFPSMVIAQWLVLRRQVSRAGWWLLAHVATFVVGTFTGAVLRVILGAEGAVLNSFPSILVYGAITGGCYGLAVATARRKGNS